MMPNLSAVRFITTAILIDCTNYVYSFIFLVVIKATVIALSVPFSSVVKNVYVNVFNLCLTKNR